MSNTPLANWASKKLVINIW